MLGMIWAQAHGRVIGRDGDLPWHLPEDLAHFKATTAGSPVLMGRKQWESLPERFRPLPGRRNIVLTRNQTYATNGAEIVSSLREAVELVRGDDAWIIGGGEVYAAAMDDANQLTVTEVDLHVDGDTFAPEIGPEWQAEVGHWQESRTGTRFRILRYDRAVV